MRYPGGKSNRQSRHFYNCQWSPPRLALYDGLCDPSRKGTTRLAVNLKEHILRTYGSERIEDEAPSAPHLTGDLHYRLLRRRWDVSREPLSGNSARVDRRHRRGDIDNKLPSISSTIHFPKLPSRAERSPDFDTKPSAPPVAPGHSACPQQFHDTGDHLLTTPDTRQASVSNTHAQPSINAPVSHYPSPTHLPHMSQMNTSVPLPIFPPSTSSYLPPTLAIIPPPTINTYFRINLQQPTPTTPGGLALLLALTVLLLVSVLSNPSTSRRNSSTSNEHLKTV